MAEDRRASPDAHTLRPLNTPRPLWVRADEAGRPTTVRRAHWSSPKAVVRVQDAWRIDDEWWRERPISRLYYTVLLEDETVLILYHDLVASAWFEQGGHARAPSRGGARPATGSDRPQAGPARGASSDRTRAGARPGPLTASKCPAPACGYVELHLHTCYSFLEGASRPEELAARAAELGYPALAVTDRNGLHGAMEFARACAALGLQPITGAELLLRHGLHDAGSGPVSLVLLAEDPRGYANLCRLITHAHRTSPREDVALDPAFLAGHTEGLIALSGGRTGEVDRLVAAGELDQAARAAQRLAELFGPHSTFLELQHNLVEGDTRRVALLAELAREVGLPVVATGDVHYHHRQRHRLQDALTAVRHHTTLEASHRLRLPNSEFHLRPPQEVAARLAAYPEALEAGLEIAHRCRGFDLSGREDLGYEFPDFARRPGEQRSSADEVLAAYCRERFEERYPTGGTGAGQATPAETGAGQATAAGTEPELRARACRQLAEELRLVAKHRLAGFFLIYRDLQELATQVAREVRGRGTVRGGSGLPPGRGRGSSVSSIICYLTGLSHVDPVRHRLFFQRFLNEDLQTVPDIDLDFARDIREELILRVYERYGHDHAALVCSFATYHLRSAVRDLGKVLGLPLPAIDKLAKLSEGGGADTVRLEMERLPEFQAQADSPLWSHLADLARQLNGLPRHVGQHVGGMIISSRPLVEMVPIQPAAMPGRFICQWDKDSCDDAGFIKVDFLALGMLSLVEECLELVWQSRGEKVDLAGISYDDPEIFEGICRGDTVGLFQVESRAQIQMLPRTQPRSLDELAVQVAIVRPGPIVGGAVNPYVRRREELRQDPSYRPRADHPLLDELLADTLGVVLYQDQVLEVAMAIGGFSPGQADQFRRAMSRRRSLEAMERFRQAFLEGARGRRVPARTAERIFEKMLAFSEFGFPKSHAYAFAVLAYQSAWLRHRYPAEYYAALLNNQPMGFYPPHVLMGDIRRRGLGVRRVALNRSGARSTVVEGEILLGLMTVEGISQEAAQRIVAEREAHGPYRSLADLLRRTGLAFGQAESLIAVGALSDLGLSRRELLWQLGLLKPPQRRPRLVSGRSAGSTGSPGNGRPRQLPLDLPIEQDMVELEEMGDWERMVADYRLLNLSPDTHPFALLRERLPEDVLSAVELRQAPDGVEVRAAGLVVCRQRPGTAKGFLFLLLEDETGLTNVVVRPDLYEAERPIIRGEPYLWVEGTVQNRSGSLNLLATRVRPLTQLQGRLVPRPPLRHAYPGNPYDPREAAARETVGERGISREAPRHQAAAQPSLLNDLELAAPASHDFR